jgi:hypothetical protein
MYVEFLLESLRRIDHSEDPRVDRRMIFGWIVGRYFWSMWIGFVWLRIGTGHGLS